MATKRLKKIFLSDIFNFEWTFSATWAGGSPIDNINILWALLFQKKGGATLKKRGGHRPPVPPPLNPPLASIRNP